MDVIKTYLDNVFAAFPQTEKVRTLKGEMLAGMEEKYHALKNEGKSENEAIGGVIANFGSIDEIALEIGIERAVADPESGIRVSGDEARDYLAQSRRSGVLIGIGVWLILAGVGALVFINGLTGSANDEFGGVGVFALLFAIAVAVPVFIVNGKRMERYEHYEEQDILLDKRTRAELEPRGTVRHTVQISFGIATIIVAVGVFIFLRSLDHETLPLVVFLLTVGFAVFLIITAATTKSAIDVLFNQGDYRDKTKNRRAERIIGTVASVYWPLAIAVFLLWSFLGDAWGISWVVWPVAGVLFGAFCGGISVWFGTGDGKR